MTGASELLLTLFLLTNLSLAGTGRLQSAIRLVAAQGWFIGLLPVLLWNWPEAGMPGAKLWVVAAVNAAVKGVALPMLLTYAVRKVRAKREVEPLVSFRLSQLTVFLLTVASLAAGRLLNVREAIASELAIPVALTTVGTGLFLLCSRRKAITQVLGFLVFENGISVFGAGILLEYGLVVELGILLDVFVLVFVLGIAICQIGRTFSSLDTDKMNRLGDIHLMHHHH
ncbi:MAG: hydrogenase [Kiritimatiellia bacterium]